MKRVFTILFGLILLSGFAGTLYYLYSKSEEPPVIYGTESPFTATIIKKTVATGSVVPRKEVEIKPQVSGIVDELFVEPGDEVKAGDLIARVRGSSPTWSTLSNAENRVNRAKINLENADSTASATAGCSTEGVISRGAFQQVRAGLRERQAKRSTRREQPGS